MAKFKNDTATIAGLLATAAGTFATFATSASPQTSTLGVPNQVLLRIGKALLLSVFVLLLVRAVVLLFRRFSADKPCKLGLQPATKADLRELHSLYERHFGTEAPMLSQMRAWHKRNSRIFQIVVALDPSTRKRRIVASFKAIPLRDGAIPLLEMEAMTGSTLTCDYIARRRGSRSAWYIGDLVSTTPTSASAIMRELREFVLHTIGDCVSIYARALTNDGLHYLRKFGFEPVGDAPMELGRVCRLLAKDMPRAIAALHSSTRRRPPQPAESMASAAKKKSATG